MSARKVLVISPHPDDETLGAGGTLLRHRADGDEIFWLNFTAMSGQLGFTAAQIERRAAEILAVRALYGFSDYFDLGLPTTRLDQVPLRDMVGKASAVFKAVRPEVIYVPFRGDIHSDHAITFDVIAACTKWFRHESVKRVLSYEVASETEFGLNPETRGFQPNVFVDISAHIDKKIEIMRTYVGEMGSFPFPRSEEGLRALAAVRGMASGYRAAEAFILLRERVP